MDKTARHIPRFFQQTAGDRSPLVVYDLCHFGPKAGDHKGKACGEFVLIGVQAGGKYKIAHGQRV
jgi:hypothetical protein